MKRLGMLAKTMILVASAGLGFSVAAKVQLQVETLNDSLERPWGLSHLGAGKMLITERNGDVRLYDGNSLSKPIEGLPSVYNVGQGGLLDVHAHPNFKQNNVVYFTLSTGSATKNRTELVRAKLVAGKLLDVETIFSAKPNKKQALHYSGRVEFLPDGTLVFAVGDGYLYMDHAQQSDSHLGKVVRLNEDGSVPKDNPFVNDSKYKPEIYTLGHRNPQGMFYDHKRGLLFSNEHGPKGGDEINIIQPGKNYGWPEITYGVDYSGDIISELTHKAGMEQPLLHWTPSIAPSSLLVYYGKEFPEFEGDILTTALKYTQIRHVKLSKVNKLIETQAKPKVLEQTVYLKERGERLRDIELDEEGRIYVITDSGKLWRISKAQ